jgi:FtsP/CotA-like multicopper oxidase with cupredoxin domain
MHSNAKQKLGVAVLLACLVALGAPGGASLAQGERPVGEVALSTTAVLPATTGTLNGSTRTFQLWAKTGTIALPGPASLPMWGYANAALGAAQTPGPALIANEGEILQVVLHNTLGERTALLFHGQAMIPDRTGVGAGGTLTYTFTAANPGTYRYEAGLTPNGQHQVALGMFGALIVRPATNPLTQAYNAASTAFVDEALVVVSEIDPDLNNAATPATFDMRKFRPRYWLINGKAYPNTVEIVVLAGDALLLRYINAGLQPHSMALLGMRQRFVAIDGNPLPFDLLCVAETLAPGQTADVIVNVPSPLPAGGRFALYDGNLLLHNNGQLGLGGRLAFGGMLTFVRVLAGAPGPDTLGPLTSGMSLAPNPATGALTVTLSATVSDATTGGATVAAAEYFVDATGASGAGTAMSPSDGGFNAVTEGAVATLAPAYLATLSSGLHTFYVHGQDSLGNWGSFNFALLNLDKAGPAAIRITLMPNPTNGGMNVMVSATGDDSASGGSNIAAGEYFSDVVGVPPGGTGFPMVVNVAAPVASLDAMIPKARVAAFSEGQHVISIRAKDALGHWGNFGTLALWVDKSGPVAANVLVAPNPNNGSMPINPSNFSLRLSATLTDPLVSLVRSNLAAAEGFIDYRGPALDPNGSGFPLMASDGLFDQPVEGAYAFIPLATISSLTDGLHTFDVHGRDAAGNWGPTTAATLWLDKGGPVISGMTLTPNPSRGVPTIVLTATATDLLSTVAGAEWYGGPAPVTPMAALDGAFNSATEVLTATINVSLWPAGTHAVFARARDAAGNWGAWARADLALGGPDTIFADSFESGTMAAWTSRTGTEMTVVPAAVMGLDGGALGLQIKVEAYGQRYVTDATPLAEPTYRARFYFDPNGGNSGSREMDIFLGFNAAGTRIFRVQWRRWYFYPVNELRAVVLTPGGEVATNWVTVTDAAHPIEIAWEASPASTFSLWIDGVLARTLAALNTNAYTVDTVQLGPSGGFSTMARGTYYFDAFVSRRYTYIGP